MPHSADCHVLFFQPLSLTDLDAAREGRSAQKAVLTPAPDMGCALSPLWAPFRHGQFPKCSQENSYFSIYTDPILIFAYFINLAVKVIPEQEYTSGMFTEFHLVSNFVIYLPE